MLPYITWAPIWDPKTKGDPYFKCNFPFLRPLTYEFKVHDKKNI